MFASPSADPTGPKLSLLWLFAILNIVFRDLHEMTTADTLTALLEGRMNGVPVTEAALLAGGVAVEMLLLAMLLSAVLPRPPARWLNLILAPIVLLGVVYIPPADPDDYFFAAVVTLTLMVIFVTAWRWNGPRGVAVRGSHVS